VTNKVPWNEKGYNCFTDCRAYTDDFCLVHTRFIEGQVIGVNEPTDAPPWGDKEGEPLQVCPLYSKGNVWHCIFCGRHWNDGPPTVKAVLVINGKAIRKKMRSCPFCREYKGLEPCDPVTCNCWKLDVVRKLAAGEITVTGRTLTKPELQNTRPVKEEVNNDSRSHSG